MKNFITNQKFLILLWVLSIVGLFIFCGHYNNTLLDIGREIIYPEQILRGKVLYKDLFNIYGPFSYLWNAFLYKTISENILTLYLSGSLCSLGIVSGIYLLSRKFLSEFLSFSVSGFCIITGICAVHLFNYTLPYSFAMLYGTLGFIYSLLFLVKFKETNSNNFLYLASLLCGLSIACKYDFFLFGGLVFVIALQTKNKRVILNSLTCLMFIPAISFIILVLQGLRPNDFVTALADVKSIISSKSLNYFYKVQGIYFSPVVIFLWLVNFFRTGVCFVGLVLGAKLAEKHKIPGWILVGIFTVITFILASVPVFMFLAPLGLILLFVGNFRNKLSPETTVLMLGALSVCAKSFWVMLPLNYGNYVLPTLLVAVFAIIFCFVDKKYEKVFAIGLLAVGFSFLTTSFSDRLKLDNPIATEKGVIYTLKSNAQATRELIKILKIRKIHKAYIYPEGLIVNFLTDTASDGYYNSLLPLYSESLGEERFIEAIEKNRPDAIVLSNQNMREYGVEYICSDYAFKICEYISENYVMSDNLNMGFGYMVFTRKR